jgi:plastocyanin
MAGRRIGTLPTIVLALVVPLVALVTVLLTLSVTDETSGGASERAGRGGSGDAVTIKNFEYAPNPIVVQAGAAITVTNDDGTVHTLTADNGTFDTGALDGGATSTITIQSPGTYKFHCDVHSYMTGWIEVR